MTLPFCGLSLAVSGSTIPPAVVSLASSRSTTTRSPNGLSVIDPCSSSNFRFAIADFGLQTWDAEANPKSKIETPKSSCPVSLDPRILDDGALHQGVSKAEPHRGRTHGA